MHLLNDRQALKAFMSMITPKAEFNLCLQKVSLYAVAGAYIITCTSESEIFEAPYKVITFDSLADACDAFCKIREDAEIYAARGYNPDYDEVEGFAIYIEAEYPDCLLTEGDCHVAA